MLALEFQQSLLTLQPQHSSKRTPENIASSSRSREYLEPGRQRGPSSHPVDKRIIYKSEWEERNRHYHCMSTCQCRPRFHSGSWGGRSVVQFTWTRRRLTSTACDGAATGRTSATCPRVGKATLLRSPHESGPIKP